MIFFSEASLRKAVGEFLTHYHAERNHQGMENRILVAGDEVGRAVGEIECRERLGGLLRYYYRKAAWPRLPWASSTTTAWRLVSAPTPVTGWLTGF